MRPAAAARSARPARALARPTKTRWHVAPCACKTSEHPERFAAKLKELLELHNFALKGYLKGEELAFQPIYDEAMKAAEQILPMLADVGVRIHAHTLEGGSVLFEGAQGTLLDVDHGTYPYVTSSNCVAGNASAGSGVGPDKLHYILGITKAYTTRVGSGRFPTRTRLGNARHGGLPPGHCWSGARAPSRAAPGAAVGWTPLRSKRSVLINGITGICLTKLDVLDGLDEIKVCTGYMLRGERVDILPLDADDIVACEPIYESFPGWEGTTFGITEWDKLPANARAYLQRVEAFIGAPIDMVSTGPDRDHTILLRHPYKG